MKTDYISQGAAAMARLRQTAAAARQIQREQLQNVIKRFHLCKLSRCSSMRHTTARFRRHYIRRHADASCTDVYSTLVRYMLRNSIGPPSLCKAI